MALTGLFYPIFILLSVRRDMTLFVSIALTAHIPGSLSVLAPFQENNRENTRSVFLILDKTWFLLRKFGKETVTFLPF